MDQFSSYFKQSLLLVFVFLSWKRHTYNGNVYVITKKSVEFVFVGLKYSVVLSGG